MNSADQLTKFFGILGSIATGLAPSSMTGMFGQNTSIGGLAANMGVSSNSSTPIPSIDLPLPKIPEISVPNLNAAGYASNVPSIGLPFFDLPLSPAPKILETSVPNLNAAGYASNVPQSNFLSPSTPQMPAVTQTPNISQTPPADLYSGLRFDDIELV
jgi:hypothetical protein